MSDILITATQELANLNYQTAIHLAATALAKNPDCLEAFVILSAAAHANPKFHDQLRNSTALRNPGIAALQANPAIFPGSVSPEMGQFLYALVTILRPQTIVETGTLFGYSTMCLAQAAKDNGCGHIHSIDLFPTKNYDKVTETTREDCGLEFVQDYIERGDVSEFVTLRRGDSAKVIESLAHEIERFTIDFAFVDGDHLMAGAQRDMAAVDKHLAVGGIVVLHDTNPKECGWMGPRYVAEKLRETGNYYVLNLNTADTLGIAILQKMSSSEELADWRPGIREVLLEQLLFNVHFRFRTAKR